MRLVIRSCCCLLALFLVAGLAAVRAAPIHEVAEGGSITKLEELLASGADVNAPDDTGTPLHWALISNKIEAIDFLLNRGADPNAEGYQGKPLEMAVGRENLQACRLLIEAGADVNAAGRSTPLVTAAKKKNLEVVSLLLENKADPNMPSPVGFMPLHQAAKVGEIKILAALISAGAKVNVLTSYGKPPIHFAVRHGHNEAVSKEQGAEPGKVDPVVGLLATANVQAGKAIAKESCKSCHSLEHEVSKYGPHLWGIFRRPIGELQGYTYSAALRELTGTWTFQPSIGMWHDQWRSSQGLKWSSLASPTSKIAQTCWHIFELWRANRTRCHNGYLEETPLPRSSLS